MHTKRMYAYVRLYQRSVSAFTVGCVYVYVSTDDCSMRACQYIVHQNKEKELPHQSVEGTQHYFGPTIVDVSLRATSNLKNELFLKVFLRVFRQKMLLAFVFFLLPQQFH